MKPKKLAKALLIVKELVALMSPEDRDAFLSHLFPDLHLPRNPDDDADGDRARCRTRLVKALGMLGSDQSGERANAALVVEQCRAKLGKSWDELIVGRPTACC